MEKNIKDFIKSNLTESEFFNLPKEDLINIKEYLLQKKEKDKEFQNLIKNPTNSIKEKCNWVDKTSFSTLQFKDGRYYLTEIFLLAKDNNNLIAIQDKKTEYFNDLATNVPKIYLLDKKVRTRLQRQKDVDMIQDELHEIDEIGRKVYDGSLQTAKSISNNFYITYIPSVGMGVWTEDRLIANFYECNFKTHDIPYLKNNNKERILTRIQLKR